MIFVDTGAFIGRYIQKDQHHAESKRGWERLERSGQRIFTSNHVIDEFATLLARKTTYSFAAKKVRLVVGADAFEILRTDGEDESRAVDLFEKYASAEVSFTDCLSFVAMRKAKIKKAFTFDAHFGKAGFERWPVANAR